MLSFLKVCLHGYYTNYQFYQISLFLDKISENHFLRIAYIKLYMKFIKVDINFRNSFQIFFFEKILFKIYNTMQTYRLEWNLCQINGVLNFTYSSYAAHMQSLIFTWKWFSVILQKTMFNWQKSEIQ